MKAFASVGVCVLLVGWPSLAAAQATKQASKQTSPGWEVDVTGGVGGATAPTMSPTQNVVPNGNLFNAPGAQGVPSVSSWFLSSSSASVIPGIQPLTPVANTPGLTSRQVGTIAGHITDWRSPTFGIEFAVSYLAGAPTSFSSAAQSAIDQSRKSFESAFGAIFGATPGSYANSAVSAVTADHSHDGGQLVITGGAVWASNSDRTAPYLTAGVGFRGRVGSDPTITVTGNYSFMAPGGVPINETDLVELRYHASNAAVFSFGTGLRRWVTSHSGIRVDFRGTLGSETHTVFVDTTPSSTTGTPAGFLVQQPANGNGTIVFSNTPTQQTSLSAAPVNDLATSSATGFRFQWSLTAGWFWRF